MQQTTKHARHKRRRAAATRVKRGGMKLVMVSQRALMMENLMYGILFSPHLQSSMPLGLQIHYLLQAPPPNCESMADSRNILYHSTNADTGYMHSKEKTLHQILRRHGGRDYYKYCAQLWVHDYDRNGCTETLLLGCKAEMELKKLIEEVIQRVTWFELAQPQDIMLKKLFKSASSLFSSRSEPLQPTWPEPMQLMENFKCDADNFSRKIKNLYDEFYNTKDASGKHVYCNESGSGINSEIVTLSYTINEKMNDIKKSLMVKLNMLEIARDIAVPNILHAYREGESDNTSNESVPEFLFSEDPAQFTANVGAFKQHLDEAVAQLKYIMGIDSHVETNWMLHNISRLPSVPRALTTSLRLAPPSPAVGKLRYDLRGFNLKPDARLSLIEKSALKKLLVERLTDEGHGSTSQSIAKHLRRWMT